MSKDRPFTFGSVCSGIEAASVAESKPCSLCKITKPLDEFHRQPRGPHGRHSWCKACANAKHPKKKQLAPARRRELNYRQRYGLTVANVDAMLAAQDGKCAICKATLKSKRFHVDHDHADGRVRGILCHRCNINLPAAEDIVWLSNALAYLKREPLP